MIRSKTFVKKTRKGNIVKVVREHYLRDDVWCGCASCAICAQSEPVLDAMPPNSGLFKCLPERKPLPAHYLVPDTNAMLHQMDVMEHPTIQNVIVLQTVLDEVRHQNLGLYQRLRTIIGDSKKKFYVFLNEHKRETYIERAGSESSNDRNDRAIRTAAAWYNAHLSTAGIKVVLLTNDRGNLEKAVASNIPAFTIHHYVQSNAANQELVDLLAFADSSLESSHADFASDPYYLRLRYDFQEHIPASQLLTSVKLGKAHQGVLQVNRDNCTEGTVRVKAFPSAVLIRGRKAMNRAMQDDVVVVRILPKHLWLTPSTQVTLDTDDEDEDEDESNEGNESTVDGASDADATAAADEDPDAPNQEVDAETIDAAVAEEAAAVDEPVDASIELTSASGSAADAGEEKRPTGVVVGILRRAWRPCCGMVVPFSDFFHTPASGTHAMDTASATTPTKMMFIPTDPRFPKVRVQTLKPAAFENQRVVITIDRWSRGSKYPEGHIVKALGTVGDKATETAVLLIEHEVRHAPFSEAVRADLPSMPWTITEQDRAVRRDFRHLDICSVDPPGCTDIDDALHVRELPNGNYEVGVHIADVSHFVKANTAMDAEAARRGTTVYLTGRRIDMLPELLGTNLCSLMCNVERFAMSVLWEVTPPRGTRDGVQIVKTEYCRSIINSRASLTYAQAQAMIDDSSRKDALSKGLRVLNAMAKVLHQRRIDRGTLTLESQEISFSLDKDTSDPVDVGSKQLLETNSMVEEFMLLANVAVAEHIYKHFPQTAVLRRHPTPPPSSFEPLVIAAKQHGVEVRASSSKELAESLDNAEDMFAKVGNAFLGKLLRILTTRCMMQAVYFCSGTLPEREHGHYGLACPIYTHFTSPIRRYPDVLVHRLLAVVIGLEIPTKDLLDKPKVAALTDNLNKRHRMAQYAQRSSVELHTILFFKKLGRVDVEAYILRVRENAIVVLVPKFGIEGHVMLSEPATSANRDKNAKKNAVSLSHDGHRLSIKEAGASEKEFSFKVFDKVTVQVSIDSSNIQKQRVTMHLVEPFIRGLSVKGLSGGAPGAGGSETEAGTSETLSRIIEESLKEGGSADTAAVTTSTSSMAADAGNAAGSSGGKSKLGKQGKSVAAAVVMMDDGNVQPQRRTASTAELDEAKGKKKARS